MWNIILIVVLIALISIIAVIVGKTPSEPPGETGRCTAEIGAINAAIGTFNKDPSYAGLDRDKVSAGCMAWMLKTDTMTITEPQKYFGCYLVVRARIRAMTSTPDNQPGGTDGPLSTVGASSESPDPLPLKCKEYINFQPGLRAALP